MESAFKKKFRRNLLQWYRKNKRDLPWRHTRDPYAIWISEVMLQQTQVVTVLPYYKKFLTRFPTLSALAQAEEGEVLALWAGLGYYRRAKLLQRGAQAVLQLFHGNLPDSAEALRSLPGIGPYTAGAIASIAFQKPEPLVDGNVVRVLSRIFARRGHAKEGKLQKEIWGLAAELIDPKHPGDFNQALMELGATLCRVALPSCERCPVHPFCRAAGRGEAESFPEPSPVQKTLRLQRAVAVVLKKDSLLLVKAQAARWFEGLWGLPHEYVGEAEGGPELLQESLHRKLGLRWEKLRGLPTTTHSITHHRIASIAWLGTASGRLKSYPSYAETRFFPLADLPAAALPNLDRKVLRAAKLLRNPT